MACSSMFAPESEADKTKLVVLPISWVDTSVYSTLEPFHTVNTSPARALVPEVVTYLKNPEVYEDVGNEATVDVDPEVTAAIPEYCISEAEICKDPVMITSWLRMLTYDAVTALEADTAYEELIEYEADRAYEELTEYEADTA